MKAKFLQHPPLKKMLLETGNNQIIEHSVNDYYWADGGDGTGKNELGNILMKIRDELREIWDIPNAVFPPWISFPNTDSGDMFGEWAWGKYTRGLESVC